MTWMMMRRWLVGVLVVTVIAGLAGGAWAADSPAAPGVASTGMTAQTVIFHVLDWTVIVVLVGASVAGVALAIDAMLHIRDETIAPRATTEHLRSLINARQFKDLLEYSAGDQTFVSQALNAGLRRAHLGYAAMQEALETAVGEQTAAVFRRIEMLNVIGNIGPLIGLLGTVLGMIIAFYELYNAGGTPHSDKLAYGIATALWHTFGGLAVAIPCLVVYGLYRSKTDRITTKAAMTAEELLEGLRPTERGAAPAAAAPAGVTRPAPVRTQGAPVAGVAGPGEG